MRPGHELPQPTNLCQIPRARSEIEMVSVPEYKSVPDVVELGVGDAFNCAFGSYWHVGRELYLAVGKSQNASTTFFVCFY